MKEIILLRHAKSSWKYESLNDIARPLNKDGFEEMQELSVWIKKKNLNPEIIYCSPAARTYHTCLLAIEAAGWSWTNVFLKPELYESSLSQYISVVKNTSDKCSSILIVGHNPVITQLSNYLSHNTNEFLTGSLQQWKLSIKHWNNLEKNCGTLAQEFIPSRHLS